MISCEQILAKDPDFGALFALPDKTDKQPNTKTFASPWPDSAFRKNDWTMTLGVGSGRLGFNTIQITSSGDVTLLLQIDNGKTAWTEYRYRVSPDVIENLVKNIDFKQLLRVYRSNGNDGTQAYLSYSFGSSTYSVWMDNYFPDQFRLICKLVISNILADKVKKAGLAHFPKDFSAPLEIYHKAFNDYLLKYQERY